MISFLDTSAVAKLFMREVATEVIERFLRNTAPTDVAIASLTHVEVRSALQRRFRNGELTPEELAYSVSAAEALARTWVAVPLSSATIRRSLYVVERHALRSLDAIQLGSALVLKDGSPPSDRFLFIASDTRLLAAATAEALPTWNPESGPAPVNSIG